MAQVPYNATPQGSQFIATPNQHVNTPVEAFGGATAQALGHLGSVASHVGDEIYARAKALQDLQNNDEATQADTDYMMKSAQMHADYGALQGEAKAKAYPGYITNLQKLRDDIGGEVSNPMARKMYDRSSRNFMAREIFNGAGQAASAQKQATFNGAQARVDAIRSTITDPQDDVGFQSRIQGTLGALDKQAEIGGWSDDETNNRKGKAVSELWSERIQLLSRTNPFQAQTVLEDAQKTGKLREQDFKRADSIVRTAMHTTGARNISEAVNSGWAPYMKQTEIDRATGVEPSLINVIKEAQRAHPELQFTIGGKGGKRTQEEQDRLYEQGRSAPGSVVTWTRDSDHLRGIAVDLQPVRGTPAEVAAAMEEASAKLGIPLAKHPFLAKKGDTGHFALPKDYDTSKAPTPPEETRQSRIERASTYARQINPTDTVFDDYTRERTGTEFDKAKANTRDIEFRATNTLDGAIVGAFGKGNLPTTVEELKASSPEVAAAWDSLGESKQRKYLSYLGKNAKGDTSWTNESLRQYQQLKGLSNADPNEFLAKDVIAENLPNSAKRELINLQQRLKANAEGDPRVRQAMQLLLPILGPADLARRTDSNKDRYDLFVGALQDQITDFTKENKRAPKNEDIQKMGAQLLQEKSTPWLLNPWSKSPAYSVPAPDADVERIKALPAWGDLNIVPTPEQIQRVYAREQFQKLYGGSAKKPEGPKVPR